MKAVIVEDEAVLLRVLEEKFKKADFEISVAVDGDEAISVIKNSQPDIVILDLILPKKSGFDVLRELKADPQLKQIPVIALSNLGQDEDIKRALQLGAEDYLVKTQHPINEVIDKVKKRLLSRSK